MNSRLVSFASGAFVLLSWSLTAEPISVRYLEGRIRGFLTVRDQENNIIGSGDLWQLAHGSRVTNTLTLHLKDGSLYEETTVFSQQRVFRLLTNHVVCKGPAFKRPMDMSLNAATGAVNIRYTDENGKEKVIADHLKLPADVSNGMVSTLLSDMDPKVPETTVSMVAATPKPRLVKLKISPAGEDSFSAGGATHKATQYAIKVEIGGVKGAIAPLVGKQPPDTHIWVIREPAPGFLRSEGQLAEGGPVWRIELASPVWPKGSQ